MRYERWSGFRALSRVGLRVGLVMLGLSCGGPASRAADPEAPVTASVESAVSHHPVTIRLPSSLGVVDTGREDAEGRPIGIACATCHEPGLEAPMAERAGLPSFHRGVTIRHGELTCETCHPPTDRGRLRLADDRRIELAQVQQLCQQCHGPQYRDYVRGSHGGMQGYWDLRRGPRERNACVVCHAAHAPAYPSVIPVFPPRDRFLEKPPTEEAGHE